MLGVLCCCCKTNLVVAHIIHRVVGPEEDITKDPQRLSILGWQIGGHNANAAIAIVVLWRKKHKFDLMDWKLTSVLCLLFTA